MAYLLPLLIAAIMTVLGLLGNKALNVYVVAQQNLRMVNLTGILALLLLFVYLNSLVHKKSLKKE